MLLATNKVIIYGVHYMEFTSKNPALTSVQVTMFLSLILY